MAWKEKNRLLMNTRTAAEAAAEGGAVRGKNAAWKESAADAAADAA